MKTIKTVFDHVIELGGRKHFSRKLSINGHIVRTIIALILPKTEWHLIGDNSYFGLTGDVKCVLKCIDINGNNISLKDFTKWNLLHLEHINRPFFESMGWESLSGNYIYTNEMGRYVMSIDNEYNCNIQLNNYPFSNTVFRGVLTSKDDFVSLCNMIL
jgi:hypothetical protein